MLESIVFQSAAEVLPRSSVVEVGVGLGELGPLGQFVDLRPDQALRARRPLLDEAADDVFA